MWNPWKTKDPIDAYHAKINETDERGYKTLISIHDGNGKVIRAWYYEGGFDTPNLLKHKAKRLLERTKNEARYGAGMVVK